MKKIALIALTLSLTATAQAEISLGMSVLSAMDNGKIHKMVVQAQPYALDFVMNGEASWEAAAWFEKLRTEIPETAQWSDEEMAEQVLNWNVQQDQNWNWENNQ